MGLTHGIAAFPNAQAYKVGKYRGDLFTSLPFLRQVWDLGGEQEQFDGDLLQLAGKADISRVTLTVGKMGVGDQFDNNAYAHDPTTQFLNWVLVRSGGVLMTPPIRWVMNTVQPWNGTRSVGLCAGGFLQYLASATVWPRTGITRRLGNRSPS